MSSVLKTIFVLSMVGTIILCLYMLAESNHKKHQSVAHFRWYIELRDTNYYSEVEPVVSDDQICFKEVTKWHKSWPLEYSTAECTTVGKGDHLLIQDRQVPRK